jgi:nitroimidazol reductase NimA-like FMN-containing flavoprotein (pyridoxamine 5'-phosphate oxidase superfamily)
MNSDGAGERARARERIAPCKAPARDVDEALICSVGFLVEGHPYVLPMAHARMGDEVVIHGAVANRLMTSSVSAPVCLSLTLVDGLVLARSAMHHSMNYRSVVIIGHAREIVDDDNSSRHCTRSSNTWSPGERTM